MSLDNNGTLIAPDGGGTLLAPDSGGTLPAFDTTATAASGVPDLPVYAIHSRRLTRIAAVPSGGGEGRVFTVDDGSRRYALKLYTLGHAPDATVLDAVACDAFDDLVKLREHGLWAAPDGHSYYYELMDLMTAGSLSDTAIASDADFRRIARGMAACIDCCHRAGFLHRDVKPANFLLRPDGRSFVLSDFGIARTIAPDEATIVTDPGKTAAYSSPEACYSSDIRSVEVGRPTDYYSMGMSLLAMCMGVAAFESANPARSLDADKRRGTLVDRFASTLKLGDPALRLLRALLDPDPERRPDFEAVMDWRWDDAQPAALDHFRIVFDGENGLVANSPAELAAMMEADPDLTSVLITRGVLTRALEQNDCVRMAAQIDDIHTRYFPKGGAALALAARLIVDRGAPWRLPCSSRLCHTHADVAAALWERRDLRYDDMLTAYFAARADLSLLADLRAYQSSEKTDADLLTLCRALDPQMPMMLCDDDGRWLPVADFAAWVELVRDNTDNIKSIATPEFAEWLGTLPDRRDNARGAMLADLLKDPKATPWLMLYTVAPELSYELTWEGGSRTPAEMGALLRDHAWTDPEARLGFSHAMLSEYRFADSPFVAFLSARKMDKYFKQMMSFFIVQAHIDEHPAAPYNIHTALWRTVASLGADICVTLSSGRRIASPDDVKGLSEAERREAVKVWHVPEMLSLFYHEKPGKVFSTVSLTDYGRLLIDHLPEAYNIASHRNGYYSHCKWLDKVEAENTAHRATSLRDKICLTGLAAALYCGFYALMEALFTPQWLTTLSHIFLGIFGLFAVIALMSLKKALGVIAIPVLIVIISKVTISGVDLLWLIAAFPQVIALTSVFAGKRKTIPQAQLDKLRTRFTIEDITCCLGTYSRTFEGQRPKMNKDIQAINSQIDNGHAGTKYTILLVTILAIYMIMFLASVFGGESKTAAKAAAAETELTDTVPTNGVNPLSTIPDLP